MKNIKGFNYKCVLCSNYDLCKLCFESHQHPEHDRFIVKQLANESWRWAQVRLKKNKKQAYQPPKEVTIK